jgi:hypothetical protein
MTPLLHMVLPIPENEGLRHGNEEVDEIRYNARPCRNLLQ